MFRGQTYPIDNNQWQLEEQAADRDSLRTFSWVGLQPEKSLRTNWAKLIDDIVEEDGERNRDFIRRVIEESKPFLEKLGRPL